MPACAEARTYPRGCSPDPNGTVHERRPTSGAAATARGAVTERQREEPARIARAWNVVIDHGAEYVFLSLSNW